MKRGHGFMASHGWLQEAERGPCLFVGFSGWNLSLSYVDSLQCFSALGVIELILSHAVLTWSLDSKIVLYPWCSKGLSIHICIYNASAMHKLLQEFIAIIVMLAFLRPEEVAKVQGQQFVEIFSGRARTSRMASWRGYASRGVDIAYSDCMNVLRPAGFMFLSCLVNLFAVFSWFCYCGLCF